MKLIVQQVRQQGKSGFAREMAERALDAGFRVYFPAERVIKRRRNGVTTIVPAAQSHGVYIIDDVTVN